MAGKPTHLDRAGKPATARGGNARRGISPAVLISGAVVTLALPSAVLAFSSTFSLPQPRLATGEPMGSFAPGTVDPRLARAIAARAPHEDGIFRFTPAGTATRPDRSITVAVRVDPETARTITVRGGLPGKAAQSGIAAIQIAPTAYNLGIARKSLDPKGVIALSNEIRGVELPDLATYRPGPAPAGSSSRFTPVIALDEKARPGSAPRTFESVGDQTVDFGGSYRVSRNINVTAGVRYMQERDRLAPLTDGKQESQAVYVGTRFRF